MKILFRRCKEDYVVDIELRARARKSTHTPPKYETRGKFTSKKLEVMIEKLNYKKYLNYPDDDTELVESTSVETIDKESEKDQDDDFVVAREYDQNEQISDDQDNVGKNYFEITMSSKTGTEIVYKPDPDIDIEEFKQEPMNEMIHEMISSLSSAPDSLDNETLNSEF